MDTPTAFSLLCHDGSTEGGFLAAKGASHGLTPSELRTRLEFLVELFDLKIKKTVIQEAEYSCIIDSYADEMPRGFFLYLREIVRTLT